MAPKKAAAPKAKSNGSDPRTMTLESRRELFLAKKKSLANDWHVLKDDEVETLVPYNSIVLDHVLKLYGMAGRGSVIQFHGDEGAGKSTLGYCVNREYQKATGEPIVIFDFERTTTPEYLRKIGIDMEMALIERPDSWEQSVQRATDLMKDGVRLFTFDSIPRMKSEVDDRLIRNKKAFGATIGRDALMMKTFYDIMLPKIAKVDGRLLMINQTRSRIEMSQEAKSANDGYSTITNLAYSLPGGRANRFAINVMVELTLKGAIKPGKWEDEWVLEPEARYGEQYLANRVRVRSLKNKVTGTGYREGHIWIRPGMGVDEDLSVRELARDLKLINAHGKRWYIGNDIDTAIKVYDDKAQAMQNLVIDADPEVMHNLRNLVIQNLKTNDAQFQFDMDDETQRFLAGEGNEEVTNMEADMVDGIEEELV
jgi:RecA/RadA recombinase